MQTVRLWWYRTQTTKALLGRGQFRLALTSPQVPSIFARHPLSYVTAVAAGLRPLCALNDRNSVRGLLWGILTLSFLSARVKIKKEEKNKKYCIDSNDLVFVCVEF